MVGILFMALRECSRGVKEKNEKKWILWVEAFSFFFYFLSDLYIGVVYIARRFRVLIY